MSVDIPDELVLRIRKKFDCQPDSITKLGGGFSGTPLYRFVVACTTWVVRGWPHSHHSINKIEAWAQSARHLQANLVDLKPLFDSSPIPFPEPWHAVGTANHKATQDANTLSVFANDMLWTLSRWVPGKPLQGEDVSYDSLQNYVQQLGRWHKIQSRMLTTRGISKGLVERLELLTTLDQSTRAIASCCSRHPLGSELAQWLVLLEKSHERWTNSLRQMVTKPYDQHWIVRDLWRENLLVDQQQRWLHTVDVGASRIDWPWFDFIRLVGSLHAYIKTRGTIDLWTDLLAHYRQENPACGPMEATDLRLIHQISASISVVYWFNRLDKQSAAPMHGEAGEKRMSEVLREILHSA